LAGSWENILRDDLGGSQKLKGKFDLILMCETLYNQNYYESLMGLIEHSLKKPSGRVIVGSKTFYFGFGGGFYDFDQYCKSNFLRFKLSCNILKKLNDMKSIERMVVEMTWGNN